MAASLDCYTHSRFLEDFACNGECWLLARFDDPARQPPVACIGPAVHEHLIVFNHDTNCADERQ